MNINAFIVWTFCGAILCCYVVPKILYIMKSVELHQARIRETEFCREDGSDWDGASPDYYTFNPKRK